MSLKVATVFSGIGAFEFALKRMNVEHEIIFACDNGEVEIDYDKEQEMARVKSLDNTDEKQKYVNELYKSKTRKTNFVKRSYLANYSCPENRFFEDICLLDGNDFKGKVDIFVGGSPCQSFSAVGYQRGLSDTRGTLFYEYARLIKEIEPKIFIYENVRNLLTHDHKNTWQIIKAVFDDLGYEIDFNVLNSKDFGIPQNRRRLFVVGYKKDYLKKPNIPTKKCELTYRLQDFLETYCKYGDFKNDIKNESVTIVSGGPYDIDEKYYLTPAVKKYVLKDGTKTWRQKAKTDLPVARTLLKTMGNCHRAGVDNYITDKEGLRMLTVRECHRLMGFTDDYKIVVSDAQAYKQAGNSIVVDVLISIINSINSSLGIMNKKAAPNNQNNRSTKAQL